MGSFVIMASYLWNKIFGNDKTSDKGFFNPMFTMIFMLLLLLVSFSCTWFIYQRHKQVKHEFNLHHEKLVEIARAQEKEILTLNKIIQDKDVAIATMSKLSEDVMRNSKQYQDIVDESDKKIRKVLDDYRVHPDEGTDNTKWEDEISNIQMETLWKGYCLNNKADKHCVQEPE